MPELGIGYIRVSTEDQERQSPETQLKDITRYISAKGWQWLKKRLRDTEIKLDDRVTGIIRIDDSRQQFEVPGIFAESHSGWTEETRPAFYQMLAYVKREKINHVIFCWTDRVARNLYDYTNFCKKLEKSNSNLHLHIINESLAFSPYLKEDYEDQKRCEGRLVESKAESGRTSQRVIKSKEDKFETGKYTYQLPYGLINTVDRETRGLRAVVVAEQAKKVKDIFKLMSSGKHSLLSLANELEIRGWKKERYNRVLGKSIEVPFTRSYLYYMLTNETYLGKVKYKGMTKLSSAIPAIVDQATFDKVQTILKSQCKFRRDEEGKEGKYRSPLARLCRCHFCGCQITTDFTINPYGQKYVYLRCTNGRRLRDINWYKHRFGKTSCIQPYNTEEGLEQAFDAEIEKFQLDEYFIAWIKGELQASYKSSKDTGIQIRRSLEERFRKASERKARLNIMRADGELTKEEFLEAKSKTLKEEDSLRQQIQETAASSGNIEDEIEITIDLLTRLRENWAEFSIEEKAEVLNIMTKKVVLGEHGKNRPDLQWEEPWAMLIQPEEKSEAGIPIEKNWRGRRDSNSRPAA